MALEWLDEIEARANAAAPGPWAAVQGWLMPLGTGQHIATFGVMDEWRIVREDQVDHGTAEANAAFAAHARTDVPKLCRAVRELAEALERVLGSQWYDLPDPLRDEANGILERWRRGGGDA